MKSDEEAAFEGRIREHQRVVYQIAYGVLQNAEDAREVAQDTFVRAFAKRAALREPAGFRAWVTRICRRLALNRLRDSSRARRRERLALAEPDRPIDVESVAGDRLFVERVRVEIEQLPAKLRAVLVLCAIEDLDHASVARMLNIPEGTVRSRLHLARKQLLKALDR